MAVNYPQPIRYQFTEPLKRFQEVSAATVKETLTNRGERQIGTSELLYMIAERDKALMAAMTAIDQVLEYLDYVKPPAAPGTVVTRIAPV